MSNVLISTGATDNLPVELNSYQETAYNAIGYARDALHQMTIKTNPLPTSTIEAGQSVGTIAYNKNGTPPIWSFSFEPPSYNIDKPMLKQVAPINVEDVGGNPPAQVTPNLPPRPTPSLPATPGDAPLITDIIIPPAPEKGSIPDPKEWAIVIPPAPVINIDPFKGITPPNNITVGDVDVDWTEDPYTSETLSGVIAAVGTYLGGGLGMPDSTWEAIWAKDNDREQRAGITARSEINKEMSDRGFQLPQGVQLSRLDKINTDILKGSQERSREISIKEGSLAIENLRFGVTQGIALEQLRGSWYQAGLDRSLRAMLSSAELAISALNAEISLYNSQVQAYTVELEAWKAGLEVELLNLQVYQSQLEAQKLIGQLNQQEVDKYVAKLQTLTIDLEYYNSTLTGLKLITEQDNSKIDAYSKEVQAYGEKIKAITSEYEGYQVAMQGAKIEVDAYAVNADAFGKTVEAYASKNQTEISKAQLTISENTQILAEYDALLKGFVTQLNAKVQDLDANQKAHVAKMSTFTSNLDSEKTSLSAQIAAKSASAQDAAQLTSVNVQNAQSNATNSLTDLQNVQSVYKAIAEVETNYASSAFSATNIGMSISDTASNQATLDE